MESINIAMALTITHAFVSTKTDGADPTQVRPSNWNANHVISGTIDETYLAFTDITTANVSTTQHGLVPKLPNDATLFLNGTGNYTIPSGNSFDLTANHTFTGTNLFSGQTQLGLFPDCDNALVTIYQTMDGSENTSMVDIVATGGGFSNMTGIVSLTATNGDMDGVINLYLQTNNDTGTIGNMTAIFIDSPIVSTHVSTSYGLQIGNQTVGNQDAAYNIYSAGFTSVNVFEGSIGIGETAPSAPLVIKFDTGSGTQGVGIRMNAVSGDSGAGLGILWTDNADVLQMAQISGQDDDHWGGRMVFWTSPQTGNTPGGTLTERMRITSAGLVGINQISPQYQLDVGGNINFTGSLLQNGSPYSGSQWTLGESGLYFSGSNVGIGNINPGYQLDVQNTVDQSVAAFSNLDPTYYSMIGLVGTQHEYRIGVGNDSVTTFPVISKWFVYDATASAMRLVIDQEGSILFGGFSAGNEIFVYPNYLSIPNINDFSTSVIGSTGSTYYSYVITLVADQRESATSLSNSVENGPDIPGVDDYVLITLPSDGNTYNIYRIAGEGGTGFIGSQSGGTFHDDQTHAFGANPHSGDRSTGITFNPTSFTRCIYAVNGELVVGTNIGSYDVETRLSNLASAWQDDVLNVSLFQNFKHSE